jgi:TctA family transporter
VLEALVAALGNLVDPVNFAWLMLGVAIGWWVGIIPGIGSLVGVAMILPFLYGMDPTAGLFLLLGIFAVNNTSDTFAAVIFGIPGGASSAATVMDGYPLAKQGQAGRALGAAFISSMIGGIIGALTLLAVLPIARPLVLALGSPELLMVTLLGLLTVGIISRGAVLLGILAAALGLLISSVGIAPTLFQPRFTFGSLLLQDGISVVTVAIGLFGVPEMLHLLTSDQSPDSERDFSRDIGKGLGEGAKDAIRNFPLVVRGGIMGSVLSIVPGVGGSIVTWLVWSSTAFSKKNKVPLGQGEIRGVIGPESANNATDGGHLVPTLLFGIPASGGMAVLLAGMTLMGVEVGPRMLEGRGLVLTISIALALCAANIMGTAVCFVVARGVARLTNVPGRVIVPFMVITLSVAAFQETRDLGSIFIMLGLGALGWAMLKLGVPRIPLLVGFVLGESVERYMWITFSRYGVEWMLFPKVLVIAALMVALIWISVALAWRARATDDSAATRMQWR